MLPAAVALVLTIATHSARAQEIDASVSVNTDKLSTSAQNELAGFGDELERYLNTTQFTTSEWEGPKVKMNFNVIFTGESPDGVYSAQLVVGSQRDIYESEDKSPMMKLLDDSWSFRYARNQPFYQETASYDELTGLVDFYVYVALGLDLDSYDFQGGAPMYDRARQIANRATIRNDIPGWSTDVQGGKYSRYGLITELTNLRYLPIRRFIYDYHYNGLDLLSKDRAAALDSMSTYVGHLVVAIDHLVEPSTLVRMLAEAKNVEFATEFRGYDDPQIWRALMYIDPGHASKYEAARDAR